MQQRHKDRKQYFDEQVYTTEKYVIPFVNEFMPITKEMSILEIGCGEGGNMKPFLDMTAISVLLRLKHVDLRKKKIITKVDFTEFLPNLIIHRVEISVSFCHTDFT